jgi:RHS repeat-associated protein
MNSKRGSVTLVNDFRYDNLYRLTKTWDNLGGFSESSPATSYNYIYGNKLAPAKVFEEARVEKTSGNFGTNGKVFLMTGSGEELASAIETDDKFKIQGLSQFKPDLGITSKVKDYLVDDDFDFSNMKIADLNFGELKLSNSINDFLGNVRNVEQAIQSGVLKATANDFTVSNGFTAATTMVNSSSNLVTEKKTNEFGYQASFKDEENNSYSFLNDSLGRVREIIFSDGVKQSVVYDSDTGSLSKVERDNLGRIEYTYNTSTMLLSEKRRYDRLEDLKLKENYAYDAIGRILTKTMLKINDDGSNGSSTVYNYSYDGLNLNSSERIGQEGFLTGVSTTSYAKTFIYREDGKILESKLTIPGFREFRTIMTYMSHGEISSRRQIVKNLTDNSIESDYVLSNEYDRLGRLQKLKKDSSLFAELSYNSFSQVDTIEISGHKDIKYLYDGLTRQSQDYKETQGSTTLFQQQWNLNNRGLISNDKFTFGTREVEKDYSYSSRGFLSGMSRDDSSGPTLTTSYGYGNQGFMTGESLDGVTKAHSMGLTSWDIGGVIYKIDTLGRVTSKGVREFEYGETGRVSHVSGTGIDEAIYIYDEENNPITKTFLLGRIEVYLGDNIYTEDNFLEPVKLGDRSVGYFKNGTFVPSSQDQINTNVLNELGVLSLALPFGERENRSEVNSILDFTLKGYDMQLGAVRMGHRHYDPIVKRFLSPDTYFLENPDKNKNNLTEGNLYSYAVNDPLNYKDSSGDCAEIISGSICAAGAIAAGVGVTWAGEITYAKAENALGYTSQREYDQKVQEINNRTADTWNSYYKPVAELVLALGNGPLAAGVSAVNAISGKDTFSLQNTKDGLSIGSKDLSNGQRALQLTSTFRGPVLDQATKGLSANSDFAIKLYDLTLDKGLGAMMERKDQQESAKK